jgi:hypothetical protein
MTFREDKVTCARPRDLLGFHIHFLPISFPKLMLSNVYMFLFVLLPTIGMWEISAPNINRYCIAVASLFEVAAYVIQSSESVMVFYEYFVGIKVVMSGPGKGQIGK